MLTPLHEAGFELLVVGLRGVGLGRPAGQTFGPAESRDITAAIQVLRDHPLVDPRRIGILGIGPAPTPPLLAAERDPGIAALVLAEPIAGSREAIARYVGPNRWPMGWLQPCSRWGWEIGYRIGQEEIDLPRFEGVLTADKTFFAEKVVEADGGLSPAFVAGRPSSARRGSMEINRPGVNGARVHTVPDIGTHLRAGQSGPIDFNPGDTQRLRVPVVFAEAQRQVARGTMTKRDNLMFHTSSDLRVMSASHARL